MRRDLIKTVAGVVLVGLVVVATYLYGNHQTQVQKQKEQTLQEQRRTTATTQNQTTTKPASKAASPSTKSPAAQTPAAIASQPPASTMPQTGAQTPLPQTGGVMNVLPLVLMIAAARLYWYSRRWALAEEPQTDV